MIKFVKFLLVKTSYFVEDYEKLYIQVVVILHGVQRSIIHIEVHNLLHSSGNIS